MAEGASTSRRPGSSDLQLDIDQVDDTTVVIAVSGEIDPYSAASLEQAVQSAASNGVQHLTLNLAGVTFMDSSGLRVVLSADEVMTAQGVKFTLTDLSDPVRRLLEITDLLDRLDVE